MAFSKRLTPDSVLFAAHLADANAAPAIKSALRFTSSSIGDTSETALSVKSSGSFQPYFKFRNSLTSTPHKAYRPQTFSLSFPPYHTRKSERHPRTCIGTIEALRGGDVSVSW